jgi:pSer/pThr/pTyr-binding forkhead associated (FHA) protein
MYCTHCGHENPAEANFCGQCGRPLRRQEAGDDSTTGGLRPDDLPQGGSPAQTDVEPPVPLADLDLGTALLVVVRGPNEGARFLLDRNVVTVGRHPDSDIFLDDVTVSRRHAEFRRDGTRFWVHDVGSLNGTYVNGERSDDRLLATGDEVQIGKFKLVAFIGGTDG